MGCSAIINREMHYGGLRETDKVVYNLIDNLKLWCRWGRIVSRETVDCVHNIRAGILHNMEDFSNFVRWIFLSSSPPGDVGQKG